LSRVEVATADNRVLEVNIQSLLGNLSSLPPIPKFSLLYPSFFTQFLDHLVNRIFIPKVVPA
jgi:hypothetical protein